MCASDVYPKKLGDDIALVIRSIPMPGHKMICVDKVAMMSTCSACAICNPWFDVLFLDNVIGEKTLRVRCIPSSE